MGRINAGQLNHRISLITDGAGVEDGQGGFLPGGEGSESQLWARVRPLRGTEALRLGQQLNGMVYEVTIRFRSDVSGSNRLTWQGKTLNVQQVLPDENKEFLTLYALDSGQ